MINLKPPSKEINASQEQLISNIEAEERPFEELQSGFLKTLHIAIIKKEPKLLKFRF